MLYPRRKGLFRGEKSLFYMEKCFYVEKMFFTWRKWKNNIHEEIILREDNVVLRGIRQNNLDFDLSSQGRWRRNLMVPLESPYMITY